MKKVMVVFGTRPEAIKMSPLIKQLQSKTAFSTIVCVTGQHRHMLDQVLNVFEIVPDYDLHIMKEHQSLFDITTGILNLLPAILDDEKPDLVLVHGDTTTTFVSALACFYRQIKVGHIEAGLRTYNLASPYPEEFNRQAVGLLANYHFAPTQKAFDTLVNEGKDINHIYLTGNTVIDALATTVSKDYDHPLFRWIDKSKLILITAHRRENIGEPMVNMFKAIKTIGLEFPDCKFVYPVHQNPKVLEIAQAILGDFDRCQLIEPLDVVDFHNFMARSYLILTDSGGIQEEAPSLHVPVLVLRDTTERHEGIEANTSRLVGTHQASIEKAIRELLVDENQYQQMASAQNPYGDGQASAKIATIIERILNLSLESNQYE